MKLISGRNRTFTSIDRCEFFVWDLLNCCLYFLRDVITNLSYGQFSVRILLNHYHAVFKKRTLCYNNITFVIIIYKDVSFCVFYIYCAFC